MADCPTPIGASEQKSLLKQALRALEQMQQKLNAAESRAREPIAIIGMNCRFPGGADDPALFWDLLRNGREAISEIPSERWKIEDYYDPDPSKPGKMVSRFGGFLDRVDRFDAAFFGIAPREAAMMDPQQRLLLEVAWHALEDAAIAPSSLHGSKTGIYLGMTNGDYAQLQMNAQDPALLDVHYASGAAHSIASGRLSYLLGLKGPSLTVDTACSSSLVAIHLACQALRSGECSMAIAGGVNIILSPETTVALSQAHMLAPDGRSKAFDDRADGFARAEGCGLVVLKPLRHAQADGDRILAVLRGSAVNQDGASSSLTAPNGPSQEELMREALANAGKVASEIGYVEAHGTGTELGDPIELRALGSVYGAAHSAGNPVLIGSLKTNFGHMEATAGVGGLIKLVLALQHAQIPAHLQFKTPTRHVPWQRLNLVVPEVTTSWLTPTRKDGKPAARIGAVSSFGFSGTNAHLIVEQASATLSSAGGEDAQDRAQILPLSARSPIALRDLLTRYLQWVQAPGSSGSSWLDIAVTASQGRDHFRFRQGFVATNKSEAVESLQGLLSKLDPQSTSASPAVTQLFTGQGSEQSGMGLDLLQHSVVFRDSIGRLDDAVAGILDKPIAEVWTNASGELSQARYVQPALYAYGWALSELWRSWGVAPRIVLGHSLGEYIAATVAGVLTAEEGIRLVAMRGRLTEQLGKPGGMIALVASETKARELLSTIPGLSIAAINGPTSVVISGDLSAIEAFEATLKDGSIRHKRLRTTHGFHSAALDPMLDAFEAEAGKISYRLPEVTWISNLTGKAVERNQPITAQYWRNHLRQSVQFEASLTAAGSPGSLLLEIGPEPQLSALAEANGIQPERLIASIGKSNTSEWHKLLTAAARLYTCGLDLNWKAVNENKPYTKIQLPLYPFQRQRYWFSDGRTRSPKKLTRSTIADPSATEHPLLSSRLNTRSKHILFHAELSAAFPNFLSQHVIGDRMVLPGAAYLEMSIAAVHQVDPRYPWSAEDVELREPCTFTNPVLLETSLEKLTGSDDAYSFEIASIPLHSSNDESDHSTESEWTIHATGLLRRDTMPQDIHSDFGKLISSFDDRSIASMNKTAFYQRFVKTGLNFGPAFQPVIRAWSGVDESLVKFELLQDVSAEQSRYQIHPICLDACLQAAAALDRPDNPIEPALPSSLASLHIWGDPATICFAHAKVSNRTNRTLTVDIIGLDSVGRCLLKLEGLTFVTLVTDPYRGWLHSIEWQPVSAPMIAPDSAHSSSTSIVITTALSTQPGSARKFSELIANGADPAMLIPMTELQTSSILSWFPMGPSSSQSPIDLFYFPPAERQTLDAASTGQEILDWHAEVLSGALSLVQTLIAADKLEHCRLFFISQGALGSSTESPDGAAVAAFARTLLAEFSEATVISVDIGEDSGSLKTLANLCRQTTPLETQYSFRGEAISVPRLSPCHLRSVPTPAAGATRDLISNSTGQSRILEVRSSGLLSDLIPTPTLRRQPGENEVEISIAATAINFHEVLSVLSSAEIPSHQTSHSPGGECSGVVVRVGAGIEDLACGDRVVAIGTGLMADFATLSRDRLWKAPANLSLEESATLLIPFLTARCALQQVAKLQPGETILIHAAAGGVGLAAIQEAHRLGATVFATAGTPAKREYLQNLGVKHIADSRSSSFEGDFLAATGFRGVDVVLNSLSAEKIDAGMRTLTSRGRFIELGESTVLTDAEASAIRPDVQYHRVHLRAALLAGTPEILAMIAGILDDVNCGRLKPLPRKRFTLAEAPEAFRYMAAGHQIGRVLLGPPPEAFGSPRPFSGIRQDGAYLVTGAFSGLGKLVVEWLAGKGAGEILALGRSEPAAETIKLFASLEQQGTRLRWLRCDVSNSQALTQAMQSLSGEYALRGIFHAAGQWDDGALEQQTPARFHSVLAAKVAGGWSLHQITKSLDLDCFVLFSSAASILASRGQANYAAANAYLDALAHYRREQLGLTALSINWGAWRDIGAAVRYGVVERSERSGTSSIAPAEGLSLLEHLLEDGCTQVLASQINWQKWAQTSTADAAANAHLLTRILVAPRPNARNERSTAEKRIGEPAMGKSSWLETLQSITESEQRPTLESLVEERIRIILSLPATQSLDRAIPLQEYGLDSLLSIELRNTLSAALGAKLPATTLFDYPTLASLTNWLFRDVLKMEPVSELGRRSSSRTQADPDVLAGVESLSDDEVEKLFQEKMAGTPK